MRNILILCAIIFSALGAMYFWVGTPKVYSGDFVEFGTPHIYNDPARTILNIKVAAFYFVPQNKIGEISDDWLEVLMVSLEKLKEFHSVQFQQRSGVEYEIYPKPVIGLKDSIEYDTESTQAGNPQALLKISQELESRVFKGNGDLYNPSLFNARAGDFPVLAIIYEGVGAVGGLIYDSDLKTRKEIAKEFDLAEDIIHIVDIEHFDGFFLVNREFLSREEYKDFGVSIFSHEFYHTLGIPDQYKEYKSIPTSQDIMGSGRFRPIEKTYINRETLKNLGF